MKGAHSAKGLLLPVLADGLFNILRSVLLCTCIIKVLMEEQRSRSACVAMSVEHHKEHVEGRFSSLAMTRYMLRLYVNYYHSSLLSLASVTLGFYCLTRGLWLIIKRKLYLQSVNPSLYLLPIQLLSKYMGMEK